MGRHIEEGALNLVTELRRSLLGTAPKELQSLLATVDDLKVYLQLAHELACISHAQYHGLSETVAMIGKCSAGCSAPTKAAPPRAGCGGSMLIDEIASLTNLSQALVHCRRGKKLSQGYQKFLLGLPDALHTMRRELLMGVYRRQPYRKFVVCDPKKRAILAAPFRDRIVHQAICQVIGGAINAAIPPRGHGQPSCRRGGP